MEVSRCSHCVAPARRLATSNGFPRRASSCPRVPCTFPRGECGEDSRFSERKAAIPISATQFDYDARARIQTSRRSSRARGRRPCPRLRPSVPPPPLSGVGDGRVDAESHAICETIVENPRGFPHPFLLRDCVQLGSSSVLSPRCATSRRERSAGNAPWHTQTTPEPFPIPELPFFVRCAAPKCKAMRRTSRVSEMATWAEALE